jgi:hypothetical protein
VAAYYPRNTSVYIGYQMLRLTEHLLVVVGSTEQRAWLTA